MIHMTIIREHYEVAELATTKDNGIYEVTLITEGKGSSGVYYREFLERYGAQTFNTGVLNFYNHTPWFADPSERDITTVASKILESWYTVEEGVAKVKARIEVLPSEREFIEFVKDSVGLSISVNGTAEYNEDTGELEITSFDTTDPYRSVDWVVAAGRGGKVDRKVEAYLNRANANPEKRVAISESYQRILENAGVKPTNTVVVKNNNKDKDGENLAVEEKLDALISSFEKLAANFETIAVEKEQKATTEANAAVVAEEAKKAVERFAESVTLIESADVLPTQKAQLIELAKTGVDVSEPVAAAVAIAKEAREQAKNVEPSSATGQIISESAGIRIPQNWR